MKGIIGKTVLITGASSGIGRAIAVEFARHKANVIINYNHSRAGAEETLKLVESNGGVGKVLQADISKESDVDRMFRTALDKFQNIHILINNAAVQGFVPSHQLSFDEFQRTLAVNINGAFLCSKRYINHRLDKHEPGVIINISSPHEIIPKPGYLPYAISKGGLKNFTQTLALEYASDGIRVNNVAPGATITPMNDAWALDPEKKKAVEKNIPLGYAANPEQISPSVVFLASDEASYITGTTLYVDGGAVLYPSYMKNWSS